ncbi:hypothetical protein [Flavihumibacter sp. CACIAM 22H1]|uniref:hypothetical protein n=1 Tax=Flavihumibacter sp. CACIAM 22H1 TaxID=1812911 RepID=UPI0007A8100B|nr:hypothetical protein [Flavihumibacter sp. CACIAM 22H1]KYP13783.1 MAG: hypothetical protein A1D16_02870 [Flavihumibacter sp. CACIAM 22H1]
MKKMLLLVFPVLLVLASCTRTYIDPRPPIDESVWLAKERGVVVYSGFDCDFFVVETRFGYSVLRGWGGFTPVRGAVLYGDFSRFGGGSFYNRSEAYIQQANVIDYWLSYWDALDLADFECSY